MRALTRGACGVARMAQVEDYTFNLQTASNVVAPPTMTGELLKLDKGPAIDHLRKQHHLRPFLLDVYRVDYNFG